MKPSWIFLAGLGIGHLLVWGLFDADPAIRQLALTAGTITIVATTAWIVWSDS